METIIVPVDGASNIKLEVLDFDTLATVFSEVTDTPVTEVEGLEYNSTGEENSWFDSVIRRLPGNAKIVKVCIWLGIFHICPQTLHNSFNTQRTRHNRILEEVVFIKPLFTVKLFFS